MDHVEKLLRETVSSSDPLLTEAASHLLSAGGKRFRASLVLLASHFGDPHAPELVRAAAVVELTHVATLYHDDVMDEAELRRGEPSANQRWGNSVAILTGDYVFARASEILADLGTDAVRMQARTFGRLVQGQILETAGPQDGADPLEHYLRVISDKTASLIASSAEFGAMFSRSGPQITRTITRACDALGMAFQLADDILDVAGESSESGKVPGTDLREGVLTLPMLYALRPADAGGAADGRLRELLGRPLDDAETEEALALLRSHTAMEEARRTTREWADQARAELATLPAGPPRAAFEALCDYVVRRTG
nr:polyprenyl synthetase family protein [Streptomonospora sp. PA3]